MAAPRCHRHDEPLVGIDLPFGALRCPGCAGHFVPEPGGVRLLEGIAGITLGQLEVLFATKSGSETLSCPGCGHVMPSVALSGTWPNVCRACGAVWFGPDELQRFIAKPDPDAAQHRARLSALEREVSGPGRRRQATPEGDVETQRALALRGPQAVGRAAPAYIAGADAFTIEQETEVI